MKKEIFMSLLFALITGLIAFPSLAQRPDQPVIVKSQLPFDKTLAKLKEVIVGEGMMVVLEADHKMMASMVREELPPSTTIAFGHPKMGVPVMKDDPRAAAVMPMLVAVRETTPGSAEVIYFSPSYLLGHFRGEKLKGTAKMMDESIKKIVEAATK